jgi:hypothetical protein
MLRSEFFAQRNAGLIREYLSLRSKGMNVRKATKAVADNYTAQTGEKISQSMVWSIIYREDYPYAAAAWVIIHKEEEEKEQRERTANGTAKAVAGGVATA